MRSVTESIGAVRRERTQMSRVDGAEPHLALEGKERHAYGFRVTDDPLRLGERRYSEETSQLTDIKRHMKTRACIILDISFKSRSCSLIDVWFRTSVIG